MSKKVLSLFMALTLFMSLFGVSASADEIEPETAAPLGEAAEAVSSELPVIEAVPEEVSSVESSVEDEPEAVNECDEAVPVEAEKADECDFSALISDRLYIAQDESAGLEGKVYVSFLPLTCIGTVYLPGSADTSRLFLSWNDEDITLSSCGTVYESGTAPIAPAGETVYYTVKRGYASLVISVKTVCGSPDVAGMFLELDESLGTIKAMNADPDHETECFGSVAFDGENYPYMSMKGRGNTTWGLDKKPYNLTFYKKADYDKKQKVELIPGTEAKKWSLLANHMDNALIRNKVGLDLANDLGIGLDSRFVDLWMNGEFLGNYLLTPKNDYKAPDGGYVLEDDNYLSSDDPQFSLPGMQEFVSIDGFRNRISVKDIGDDAVDKGVDAAAVEAYMLEAWDALRDYKSEDYQNYFDLDSWAKQFLVYEAVKPIDAYSGSMLMHRDGLDADDKLIAGPSWDMDNSMGVMIGKPLSGISLSVRLTADGWYSDSIGLIASDAPVSLLQELEKHPSFMERVSEIFNEYRSAFERMTSNIEQQRQLVAQSASMNGERWGWTFGVYMVPAPLVIGTGRYAVYYEPTLTWDNYVNNMRSFVTKRVSFLSDHLSAEYPVGTIEGETEVKNGDTLELRAVLTAGNTRNSYLWQRKGSDGWETVEGAEGDTLRLTVTEADNGTKYRCVVQNYGPEIYMEHVHGVKASASTKLDSVKITVTPHEHSCVSRVVAPTCTEEGYTEYVCRCGYSYKEDIVKATGHNYSDGFCSECGEKDPDAKYGTKKVDASLSDGTLTLVMNKTELGEYTFRKAADGWTIRNAEGCYIASDGSKLTVSDTPFVWSYSGGVFYTNVRLSFTTLGKLLGIQHTERVYLTVSKGSLSVSLLSGAKASFQKTVEYLIA